MGSGPISREGEIWGTVWTPQSKFASCSQKMEVLDDRGPETDLLEWTAMQLCQMIRSLERTNFAAKWE